MPMMSELLAFAFCDRDASGRGFIGLITGSIFTFKKCVEQLMHGS